MVSIAPTSSAPTPGAPAASRDASALWALWALHLVNLLLILREISAVLARIELKGYRNFGMSALTGWHWLPWDYKKELGPALVMWDSSGVARQANSWAHWHLRVDFILIISLTILFYIAIKRLQTKGRLNKSKWILCAPLTYGFFDFFENVCTWRLVSRDTPKLENVPRGLAHVTAFITDAKWITFALCVIIVFVGLLFRGDDGKSPWWETTVGKINTVRVPVAGVLFLFFLLVVPGGGALDQLPDILRAQAESIWMLLGPSLALLFLSGAVWLSSLLSASQSDKPHETDSTTKLGWMQPVVACAAIVFVLAVKEIPSDWPFQISNGALALPIVLLAGSGAAFLLQHLQAPSAAGNPALRNKVRLASGVRPSAEIIGNIGRTLAAVVVASGGLALVRAFAGPTLAPITQQSPGPELRWLIVGVCITYAPVLIILLSDACSVRNTRGSIFDSRYSGPGTTGAEKSQPRHRKGREQVQALPNTPTETRSQESSASTPAIRRAAMRGWYIVVAGVAAAGVFVWRPAYAEEFGPEGVILFLVGVGVIFAALIDASKLSTAPGAVSERLGFSTRPILLTAIITFLIAGSLDDLTRYHAARLTPSAAQSATTLPGDPPSLDNEVAKWKEQLTACLAVHNLPTKALPMVLVAAPGGGIRAAFWTGLALDRMSRQPCGREQIFVASGVSGGSLGLATWAAYPDSAVPALAAMSKPGPLTQSITAMLLRDIPRGFLGIHPPWRDRAAVLEDEWANAVPEGRLNRNWNSVRSYATWTPHLILNATDIQRGCRILITTLPRSITVPTVSDRSPGDCTSRTQPEPGARTQFAAGSVDSRDFTSREPCEGPQMDATMRISTAALLSARFPYVSPTGGLMACPPPTGHGSGDVDPTRVLSGDGGYRDNTGLTTLLEFWDLLEPAIARSNEGSSQPVVPVFVFLDNHYRSSAQRKSLGKKSEFLAPLEGRNAATHSAGQAVLEQRTASISTEALPGLSTPCPFGRWHIVAPRAGPGPTAPLGWVLSPSSQQRLTHQIDTDSNDGGMILVQFALRSIRTWERPST